ncbi:uncharacterized protein LOC115985102 [Quercus lobata]|uniref:F-box protein n=1 Tax=Quercus lobata TaxID=97700 RepID=A0A7N2LH83_QUELO|nr:uncharacterized protein LOC115985102 [Quercus lobata]
MAYCVSLIFEVLTLMVKLYICGTPASRKFKRLPDSSLAGAASGLAYHCQTHDYKVVKLWFSSHVNIFENIIPPLEAEVYSLSSDSWRRVETSLRPKVGVYDSNINAISGATFKIALPDVSADRLQEQSLAVFKGNLAYFTFSYPNLILSIWVMGEFGMEESWNELFVMQTKYSIESFGCTMRSELLVGSLVKGGYVVVSLDPETCCVKNSGIQHVQLWYYFRGKPCVT